MNMGRFGSLGKRRLCRSLRDRMGGRRHVPAASLNTGPPL